MAMARGNIDRQPATGHLWPRGPACRTRKGARRGAQQRARRSACAVWVRANVGVLGAWCGVAYERVRVLRVGSPRRGESLPRSRAALAYATDFRLSPSIPSDFATSSRVWPMPTMSPFAVR